MRVNYLFLFVVLVCITFAGIISCHHKKNDDVTPGGGKSGFDRGAMLANIGNNVILANYKSLAASVNKLDSAITDFNLSPDNTKLSNLQSIFKDAYRAWQSCSAFEFGPADAVFLSSNCNTFPVDTNRINSNITSGSYNLGTGSNLAAKGFPGIDYLLFGTGPDNNVILARYTTGGLAANRKQYLTNICNDIQGYINSVLNGWLPSGGNYIHTFVTATGTDIGSSTGLLVNSMDLDFEILKNNKIGIPAGKQSGGVLLPGKVEALYCGISAELATLHCENTQNIYLGKSSAGVNGLGFDDYLISLNAKTSDGSVLNTAIKNQFAYALSKCRAMPDPLSATVQNNTAVVNATYQELQKLVVLLKTDMPSAMAILITYEDNDGD
jgi:predicted lipoprotein